MIGSEKGSCFTSDLIDMPSSKTAGNHRNSSGTAARAEPVSLNAPVGKDSPDSGGFEAKGRASDRLGQRKSRAAGVNGD
jgi:hypothetical protein